MGKSDGRRSVIDLKYSLVIEATEHPTYFGFYSPDLDGFTGTGRSIEDCLSRARSGMEEHVALLKERGLPIPPPIRIRPSPSKTRSLSAKPSRIGYH